MACAAAATVALIAVPVTPASVALADGTSVAEHHPLPSDTTVPPTIGDRKFSGDDSHPAIARAGTSLTQGTFLDVDNFTADPPGEWEGPFCPSDDSQSPPSPTCLYFGGGQDAPPTILFDDGPASAWTAGPASQPRTMQCSGPTWS